MIYTAKDINFIRFCSDGRKKVLPIPKYPIPYCDLTYCIDGEMTYIYDGKEYTLHANDAIFIPQGSVRERIGSSTPTYYASFNVTFPQNYVPEISGFLPNSVRSDTVNMLESEKKCFNSVSLYKNEKCSNIFLYLYYQLIETAHDNEHPHIKDIKKYIAKNLCNKISLADIAEAVHLEPHYCCSLFSRYIGMSIFEFVRQRRIETAESLLITTDIPLSEIAESCGFEDYNYFSRIFKRQVGISAMRYRKINRDIF